jgi:hypothetical protein
MRKVLLLCLLALGCQPPFDRRPSQVEGPRVLAVRSEPAEAPPGGTVSLSALVVDPFGERSVAARWAFCMKRPLLADNNTVAPECAQEESEWIRPVPEVQELATAAILPADGCQAFGSETPPPPPGQPPLRPMDPDPTGGYYQPVRVVTPIATAFGRVRLQCALAQVNADVVRAFRERYTPNQHPLIEALEAGAAVVGAGAQVPLRASIGPEQAERYVAYDVASQSLVERQETLRVSWFATAGALALDVGTPDPEGADNVWTAGSQPGVARLWAVLRDDRGGVFWRSVAIEVR